MLVEDLLEAFGTWVMQMHVESVGVVDYWTVSEVDAVRQENE